MRCDICAKGNMSALPFVKSGGPCNKKLHIVFSDIVGPMNCESKSGAKYFITFIDDCTRWCEVFFLSAKSKALEALQYTRIMLKTLQG